MFCVNDAAFATSAINDIQMPFNLSRGARSSRQQVDARDPHSSSAPHQHAANWTCPGGSCRDLPSQARPGLFRATKSAFWSQDSRRELTNSKTPKTVKMRAQGPRSRGLGPWVQPARELEEAAALCPCCPVRSGSVRCPGCRGVTASRAIRNESVFRGARDHPCEVRGADLSCLSLAYLYFYTTPPWDCATCGSE